MLLRGKAAGGKGDWGRRLDRFLGSTSCVVTRDSRRERKEEEMGNMKPQTETIDSWQSSSIGQMRERTFAKYLQTVSAEAPRSWLNGQAFPA